MGQKVRVLLVEDHHVVRRGLRFVLERDPGVVVVGEAADAESALSMLSLVGPDVVLMDVRLPGMSGVDATRLIRATPRSPRVLVLSNYDDDEFVHHVLRQGASGYLLKNVTERELVDAIRRVAVGEAVLPPSIARKVLSNYQAKTQLPPHSSLSAREKEVFLLVASGLSNREIAQRLCLSVRTVGNHVTAIYQKLRLNKRAEAVLYALRHGLIEQPREVATPFN